MTDKVDALIGLLFDKTADLGGRDDAAMELQLYHQDDRALMALVKLASNPDEEEEFFVDVCGESIAEIFIQQDRFRRELLDNLHPIAKWSVARYIGSCKPEWIKEHELEEFLE